MTPTLDEVGQALARAGHYRVMQAQRVASEGAPDGISGALLLALGLRETGLRNIEGGAKRVGDRWVALGPQDAHLMDVGWAQISRKHHSERLRRLPAVKNGTWGPVVPGFTPDDYGYVPRFTDALRFTIDEMHESIAFGMEEGGLSQEAAVRFGVAAHNAGAGGALSGLRAGDVDRFTAHGNYSADVLATRTLVNRWLGDHPNWKP